jgi:hypothetical protein
MECSREATIDAWRQRITAAAALQQCCGRPKCHKTSHPVVCTSRSLKVSCPVPVVDPPFANQNGFNYNLQKQRINRKCHPPELDKTSNTSYLLTSESWKLNGKCSINSCAKSLFKKLICKTANLSSGAYSYVLKYLFQPHF